MFPILRPICSEEPLEPGFVEGKAIDPEALEEELRRRVEARKASGAYSHEVESALAERLPDEPDAEALPPAAALDYAATRAMSSWEVTAAYPVATDRRLLRPFIIFAKRLARLWARIAVGPIQREQTAFNRHVATALEALRREALEERSRALAAEEDLCAVASAMTGPTPAPLASAVSDALHGAAQVTVLGPAAPGLLDDLEMGISVTRVSPPTAWDVPGPGTTMPSGPVAFITQLAEGSLEAVLVSDLAFFLRPERLVELARRSYLALAGGGRLVVAVQPLGGPSPGWCTPASVDRALRLAGFQVDQGIDEEASPTGWFVSVGRKG
ncbi:MAG: hypothetical protein KKF41_01745 [Actinobacteria bacterium]|nr:hypothetical protein [Actinomycetota bacterium]MBU1942417.1 hypothetical protein [Actinomycetota bacterium]MBU2686289.1 hypothetical protein [Actinomycetota bacterium]